MKRPFQIFSFLIIIFSFSGIAAQEMLIMNDTIDWTMTSANGYYFFQPPSSAPSNWRTPDDYYNGQWYTRYEIISEATDEPCGLQVGIWQYRLESNIQDGEKTYSEIMASIVAMDGPGDVSFNNSSPSTWWRTYEGVDFNRIGDLWHLGINIWSLNPRSVIANDNWGGDNALWAERDKWFPIKVYVTVVAVSQGHSFSGWDNYINSTPKPPPTPDYSVDFTAETTAETVPSSDEYSYSADMSNATNGSNQVVALTPGQNIYFRTKASGDTPASGIQQLNVPSRPAKPVFTYDPDNERTGQTVSSEYQYATSASMSDAVSGTGSYVSFPAGSKRYFQKKATGSDFASNVQEVIGYSMDPPAYEVDFLNERTSIPVATEDEYSYDNFATEGTPGEGDYLSLNPGENLYFRRAANGSVPASDVQTLNVPDRPEGPSFKIDFLNETTQGPVAEDIEYRLEEETQWTAGSGESLPVIPGGTYLFRTKASESAFHSDSSVLSAPERPAAPSFEIDFVNESTQAPVPEEIEVSASASFSPYEAGNNEPLPLIPGIVQYFRVAATETSFRSEPQSLSVPQRPSLSSVDGSDTIHTSPVTIQASFDDPVTGFDLASLETSNVMLANLTGEYVFEAHPTIPDSDMSIKIPANMVNEGNFASEILTMYFVGVVQSVREDPSDGFTVYPNPFSETITISLERNVPGRTQVRVMDITGKLVVQTSLELVKTSLLDLSHLEKGLYVLQIERKGEVHTRVIQKTTD